MIHRAIYRSQIIFERHSKDIILAGYSKFWHDFEQKKTLFSDTYLGINKFNYHRGKINYTFGKHKEFFCENLDKQLKNNENIQSDDLYNFIHLCQNEKHIKLLKKCIDKYTKDCISSNEGVMFGKTVMSLAYALDNESIVQWLKEKDNISFFNNRRSILIALEILLKKKKYQELIDLFDYVTENYDIRLSPNSHLTLYFAACQQLNTLESFTLAYNKFREYDGTDIGHRSEAFFYSLAINQDRSGIAYELIKLRNRHYPSVINNLKLQIHINLEMYSLIPSTMEYMLQKSQRISSEIIDQIENTLSNIGDKTILERFSNLKNKFVEKDLISNDTLNDMLFESISNKRNENISTNNGDKEKLELLNK